MISARGHVVVEKAGVDPRAGDLVVQLPRDAAPSAHIRGRVLGPDGVSVAGVGVEAFRREPPTSLVGELREDGTFSIEVPAGSWTLRVEHFDHPKMALGPREVQPGEVWDHGTIPLANGGAVVVHDSGEPGASYLVLRDDGQFVCGIYNPDPPPRSELLAPGDYLLMIRGDGIAARTLPFAIRPGEATDLELRSARGVRQRVEVVPVRGREPERSVGIEIRRDGELVARNTARGDPLACEVWLEPGRYTVGTHERTPPVRAELIVGATEGAPVRVELR